MKRAPKDYTYTLAMKVRDYECDLQGVVNNARYLHYMEHTRHEFWLLIGESFARMHQKGLDAFVYKVTATYKASLRSGEKFLSCLSCKKRGAKLIFEQAIFKEDGTLCVLGEVETVLTQNGVITRGEYFEGMMEQVRAYQEAHPQS